jgi:hypothetical protein
VKISVGGFTFTCTTANQTGEISAATETLDLVPTYAGCTSFGFIGVQVTGFSSTGCFWQYHSNGSLDLTCNSGDVQIDAGTCTMTLEASQNQDLKAVTLTNTPAGKVTSDMNVAALHMVVTTGFGCSIAGGTYSNGTMSGTYVMDGKNRKGTAIAIDVQ